MVGGFILALIVAVAEFYFLLTRLMKMDEPKPEKPTTKFLKKKVSTIQSEIDKVADKMLTVKNLTLKKNE